METDSRDEAHDVAQPDLKRAFGLGFGTGATIGGVTLLDHLIRDGRPLFMATIWVAGAVLAGTGFVIFTAVSAWRRNRRSES